MGQWIKGNFFTSKSFNDKRTRLLKSSVYKEVDHIGEGYKPSTGGNGVLYEWKNVPLAYWDVPTLNNMVFSRALWESIHENQFIKASMENKCFWGEAFHADSYEVLIPNITIRVNDFHCDDNNMVLGDVDLMDTPNGLIVYSLAKTGRIGNSSRGFGELIDRGDGMQDVSVDDYVAVDWDCVTFPAVPNCMAMSTSPAEEGYKASREIGNLEQTLRSAIAEAYQKQPENPFIAQFYGLMNGRKVDASYPLASSVNKLYKRSFPSDASLIRHTSRR